MISETLPPVTMDFQVSVLARTPYPQALVYAAMHQDYSEAWIEEERGEFPSESRCGEIAVKRLLAGNRGHFGSLEHPQITFGVGYFPHSVMQQARTHRVGVSFDVQCLSGDSEVTFVNKDGTSSPKLRKTMDELYDLWTNGEKATRERRVAGRNGEPPGIYRRDCKRRIRGMRVRSLDESSNTFVSNHIEDVVFNGLNPVYKVTLADGKRLTCTQNHRILTPFGWRVLAQLGVGSQVMVNGKPEAYAATTYQDKEWLKDKFSKGMIPREVASIVGCSAEAVKKWAYHHGLTWTKRQWNKGTRYSIPLSNEERERRSNHAKSLNAKRSELGLVLSGKDHPHWKADLPNEKRAYNWLKYQRNRIISEKGGVCRGCGASDRLHVHHIESVKDRPDLAFDESNLEILCATCHARHHKQGTKNPLCAHPVEIVSIEYAGIKATYDLVMKSPHHNFVANGIVVHNSMRYTGKRIVEVAKGDRPVEEAFYLRPVGYYHDRSGTKYYYSEERRERDLAWCLQAAIHYRQDLEAGVAEEHARGKLPFDYRQHFVVSFNLRSLMHFLDLRAKKDAQLEIQMLCDLLVPHFQGWTPEIAAWYVQERLGKARLSP